MFGHWIYPGWSRINPDFIGFIRDQATNTTRWRQSVTNLLQTTHASKTVKFKIHRSRPIPLKSSVFRRFKWNWSHLNLDLCVIFNNMENVVSEFFPNIPYKSHEIHWIYVGSRIPDKSNTDTSKKMDQRSKRLESKITCDARVKEHFCWKANPQLRLWLTYINLYQRILTLQFRIYHISLRKRRKRRSRLLAKKFGEEVAFEKRR